jgi:hypothetical protein
VQLVNRQLVSLRHGGHNALGRIAAALFRHMGLVFLPQLLKSPFHLSRFLLQLPLFSSPQLD